MKKWDIRKTLKDFPSGYTAGDIISVLLENRGMTDPGTRETFLHPKDPHELTAADVGIDPGVLKIAVKRILRAVENRESVVVYADYDADGITAGTVMWETLHKMGASVMPYIPHRVDEGYGLSKKGIDFLKQEYNPTLIITVDHGITGAEKVEYAKSLGIEVIVTDHHTKGDTVPDCTVVHTTQLCGAGVSWFVSHALSKEKNDELVALACIGTIADLVPLTGANRSIAKRGLAVLNGTRRVGLNAMLSDAGLTKGELSAYDVSHVLAPRLNAMGRLEHAMDALRLLCTGREDKAMLLARKLGLTNKERQQLTIDTSAHAKQSIEDSIRSEASKKILFIAQESYNQGIIGLVAGKLVEEYYLPSIVLAQGPEISKASARSIAGFNIVDAIRSCSDLLIDVGGHPMAAGFTVETKNLTALRERLEAIASERITPEMLQRIVKIDCQLALADVTLDLWSAMKSFEPFGFGNTEPVFSTEGVSVTDARTVGKEGKHLKLKVRQDGTSVDAIAFGFGNLAPQLVSDTRADIAYTVDLNVWNGKKSLQLKVRDIRVL